MNDGFSSRAPEILERNLATKPWEEICFLKAIPKSMDLSLLIDKQKDFFE
jgi:hypothetical protein